MVKPLWQSSKPAGHGRALAAVAQQQRRGQREQGAADDGRGEGMGWWASCEEAQQHGPGRLQSSLCYYAATRTLTCTKGRLPKKKPPPRNRTVLWSRREGVRKVYGSVALVVPALRGAPLPGEQARVTPCSPKLAVKHAQQPQHVSQCTFIRQRPRCCLRTNVHWLTCRGCGAYLTRLHHQMHAAMQRQTHHKTAPTTLYSPNLPYGMLPTPATKGANVRTMGTKRASTTWAGRAAGQWA